MALAFGAPAAVVAAALALLPSPASAQDVVQPPPPVVAQTQTPERARLRFVVSAAAGGSFNEREQRLPVSPVGFARMALESWNSISDFDLGMFIGGAAMGVMVNEFPDGGQTGTQTEMYADFVATAEVGLIFGMPGEPYILGYVGRGFPARAERFNPAGAQDRRYRRYTWGGGGGISPRIGQLRLMLEARWRRDGRLVLGKGDSVEVLIGLPFRSG